jgi:SAM-dependent methyltransferase
MAAEFGARRVLDVGCGTGTFACLLAERGLEVTGVSGEYVSYRRTYVFAADGATLTSDSTRRLRTRAELEDSLQAAGYTLADVRDAPDRPGREWVVIAVRPEGRP